ncbi:putative peptidase [Posidoniimonas corsicana]|uniref:Putative peptidase n=1 Tax=Posidoniimonas corsicana TaxID=1938618 RepID=A0A5C5VC34_9BACT|nr:Xaa-Pro peptidase family protein [Posidoniimonas corsicana]TWT35409.1 putative peptidase [Posidoniimonas corsicana]
MSNPWDVDLNACRGRQQRLLAEMNRLGVGLVVLSRSKSVQWLTGGYVGPLFPVLAAIDAQGRTVLVLPSRKVKISAAADEVHGYEEKLLSTMRDAPDQIVASVATLFDHLAPPTGRVACEFSAASHHLTRSWSDDWLDFDSVVFALRRQKDPDELRMLARANEANEAMYRAARQIVKPGVNELEVYRELHSVAVETLGEPLTYFGQDFQACSRGGPPRDRKCEAGELYILDLGVGFRGYYSDNARTLAVGGDPSPQQQKAWDLIGEVFALVESTVAPGASCKALFEQVNHLLADAAPWLFNHHLGHGVGLAPHEGPHLNPNWDDTFKPGDFFTAEPGLYHEELRAGMRLEQNYLVTETGVQLLTDWPLGMV